MTEAGQNLFVGVELDTIEEDLHRTCCVDILSVGFLWKAI
jgi:hypothetical protein